MTPARAVLLQGTIAVLVSVASVWAATQWAAVTFAYQPALGAPLADLGVLKLYAPWQLFAWWLASTPRHRVSSPLPVPSPPSAGC